MRQPAIILARVLGYIDVPELHRGKVYFPDLIRELVERYKFQKFPQTLEESDLKKGIEFLDGISGKQPIQKFAIWDTLMVVETLTDTDDSMAVLREILTWGVEKFGLASGPEAIKRFAYISDLTFYCDRPILDINPAIKTLTDQVNRNLSEIWKEPIVYEPIILRIGHDPLARKNDIASFTIERRGGAGFSENKYFSEAPLPTKTHIQLLKQLEKALTI